MHPVVELLNNSFVYWLLRSCFERLCISIKNAQCCSSNRYVHCFVTASNALLCTNNIDK